jgi:hypothetical protein
MISDRVLFRLIVVVLIVVVLLAVVLIGPALGEMNARIIQVLFR